MAKSDPRDIDPPAKKAPAEPMPAKKAPGKETPEKKTSGQRKTGKKSGGKFHYNPVNMSGKEAGIIEESEQRENDEDGVAHQPSKSR